MIILPFGYKEYDFIFDTKNNHKFNIINSYMTYKMREL